MTPHSEAGNVIVFILIAVVLFGALSFTVMRGSSSGTSMMTNEQAYTSARQIMAYGNDVQQAVRRIGLRGIADTGISFANPIVTAGYDNAACTTPGCRVFDAAGGGLAWVSPSPGLNDGTEWLYTTNQIPGVGATTGAELMLLLRNVPLTVCGKINEIVSFGPVGGPPPQDTSVISLAQFTGAYGATVLDDGTNFIRKRQGCFQGGGTPPTGTYHYFHVLLAR